MKPSLIYPLTGNDESKVTHDAVDEEVDRGVDGHEEQGDGGHDHDPERQQVAAAVVVVAVLPESVDPEELVEVQENPVRGTMEKIVANEP